MRSSHLPVAALAVALAAATPAHAQCGDSAAAPSRDTTTRVIRMGDLMGGTRAALGVSTASSGRRDTLGLLIVNVMPDGPADSAGLQEGDRIISINGVSLKLSAADAGEPDMQGLTTRRLVRELGKVKAGDTVALEVYSNSASRTVKVKTGRSSDVYGRDFRRGFRFYFGREGVVPPVPPTPPMPPAREMRRLQMELNDLLPRMREELHGTQSSVGAAMPSSIVWRSGLELAEMNADLASYFGKGSENGFLVLRANDSWAPLRAGDVVLSVNGEPVRQGARSSISLDRRQDNRLEILRKGKKETVVVREAVASGGGTANGRP